MNESLHPHHAMDGAAPDAAAATGITALTTLVAEAGAATDATTLLACLAGAIERALVPRVCGIYLPAGEGHDGP
ncbi:MAG TPA: hypothetical protein GX714_12880, partial [Chloroflexi bacterium]|nr:hypothetical protein [Chloroflexota bacterium]